MINEKEFEDSTFLVTLENSVVFNGKANPKAIFGKIIQRFPEIKTDMAYFKQVIDNIVTQVNEMDINEQKRKLVDLNPKFFDKPQKTEKKNKNDKAELTDLPNHSGAFIGRFAPAPSGYLHIGHLRNLVFNYEYKKKYGGKFFVRFEDTNPDKIKLENYDKILEDIKWITENNIDEVYYQSDRLEIYYKYLRELIETGKAYVCECEAEVFKAFNDASEACPHRERDIERQRYLFDKFFRKQSDRPYEDGEAVIRFKGDLANKNPALRDFPIARLNSNSHARTGNKYRLWPMYNFAVSVDDFLMGMNYIVRGKDAEIGGVRQDMIKDALGMKKCPYYHFGMMNFTDIELGKTPIKEKIEASVYSGWDDPRVPTLVSFRKRGFKAEAFRNMLVNMGMTKRDMKMTEKEYFKQINYFNKQILEKEANRYSFISNPKEVVVSNMSDYKGTEVILPKHPDFKERGNRKIIVRNNYLIDGIDFENINKGDIIRLMHFANFKIIDKKDDKLELEYISKEYDKNLSLARNIQFVPFRDDEHKKVEIIMQNAQKLKGVCEWIENLKPETSLQFERFGFVKFNHKNDDGVKVFYFTHR